jgi:hypothetical protein
MGRTVRLRLTVTRWVVALWNIDTGELVRTWIPKADRPPDRHRAYDNALLWLRRHGFTYTITERGTFTKEESC